MTISRGEGGPRLGAHVGGKGGLEAVPAYAYEIGCESVQIFASSPQMWRLPSTKPAVEAAFREGCATYGLGPVAIHAIYLVSPGSEDAQMREKTVASLVATLEAADRLGASVVVTHLGSAKTSDRGEVLARACASFESVLAAYDGGASLLLETSAGAGATLGGTFEELGAIIKAVGAPPNLGVCVDTAHIFTAGYDLRGADAVAAVFEALDAHVGIERLGAVHLNDSKAPFGSNRDRHENLGDGEIGMGALGHVLAHPALTGLPVLLEVPGLQGGGPDLGNMERLYRAAGREPPRNRQTRA
ncbi:MAG: deoxyribonuclease IV [Chloroflexota bacterium]